MFIKKNFSLKVIVLMTLFTVITSTLLSKTKAAPQKKVTVMCYMNGDNNLAGEVFHAIDMMETIGSSDDIDILALVDGSPGNNGGYGNQWEHTKLLRIVKDDKIGEINSQVIADLGEQNLGDPQLLERFIKSCLKYQSEKYVFILFAHGRGIIDTNRLSNSNDHKSLFLSPDDTNERSMSHHEFSLAVKKGLSGKKFHLMLFFSCLTNMVEVGYGLRDVTNYMIGSEDEIRLVNTPPGAFQIRGIELEKFISGLTVSLDKPVLNLGKETIDSFIAQYETNAIIQREGGAKAVKKHQATLALIDCRKYDKLVIALDKLSKCLINKIKGDTTSKIILTNIESALLATQKYPSFLNLEYYDLQDLLENISRQSNDPQIKYLCKNALGVLKNKLIVYERHTRGNQSNGVSIFLPSFLVPENIYQAHMSLYKKTRFSINTSWSDLIDAYRRNMLEYHTEILLDAYNNAYKQSDTVALEQLSSKIPWALRKDILRGKLTSTKRYLNILDNIDRVKTPPPSLLGLYNILNSPGANLQITGDLRRKIELIMKTNRPASADV